MTITDRPANPRPGRATRTVVYPAFTQTGPEEPVEGTRGIYLYLRLSKYHRDGADAIERQRLDLLRKLNTEGGWTVLGEYIDNDSTSASAVRNRKGWRQLCPASRSWQDFLVLKVGDVRVGLVAGQ